MDSDYKWYILYSKRRRLRAAELMTALEEREIEAVLIKGAAVERFYPRDVARPAYDIDIAVNPENFAEVAELLKAGDLGAQDVDLHDGLRHFDTRDWREIYKRSKTVDIDGINLRLLSEEDQLRVSSIHWLTDGGERRERVADIYYLVTNRPDTFDWDYALNADGLIRRGWIIAAIGVAHKFMDLEIDSMTFADEARNLPKWFTDTLEKRWNDEVKFTPIDTYLMDPLNFVRQLKRRFPPNPIMASIMTEAPFDSGNRLKYQISYFFQRAIPSLRRSLLTFYNLLKPQK